MKKFLLSVICVAILAGCTAQGSNDEGTSNNTSGTTTGNTTNSAKATATPKAK